jgi:hypothetical protein
LKISLCYRTDLDENAREVHGSLYCLPCHNRLDLPVCGACRLLIDDRVISALGKQWHVEVNIQLTMIDADSISSISAVRDVDNHFVGVNILKTKV